MSEWYNANEKRPENESLIIVCYLCGFVEVYRYFEEDGFRLFNDGFYPYDNGDIDKWAYVSIPEGYERLTCDDEIC